MGVVGVIRVFVVQDALAAKRVDESSSACKGIGGQSSLSRGYDAKGEVSSVKHVHTGTGSATDHEAKLDTLLHVLLLAHHLLFEEGLVSKRGSLAERLGHYRSHSHGGGGKRDWRLNTRRWY